MLGRDVGAGGRAVASQCESCLVESQLGTFLWSLYVLSVYTLVFSGYNGFLPQTKNIC